jgi:CO dehydrogenase/acetyl-CoA synthase alpha subunit
MRKEYHSLSAFYRDFEGEDKDFVSIRDVDALIERLKSEKNAEVIELPHGDVIVQIPCAMSSKHLPQKKHAKANYTKLSVSVRKEDALRFSEACRKLGVAQTDVIMPVIRKTIAAAERLE